MDVEMEEFFDETFCFEGIDFDYEFDAPKFFDFSRVETDLEAGEAELWLENAGNYPPSPFVIDWNWKDVHFESASNYSLDTGTESYYRMNEGTVGVIAKSPLSENSRFMNPTANQLARQNHASEFRCPRLLRGSQKKSIKNVQKSSCNSLANGANKRQKLESGYMLKVARLKHQAQFIHKAPQKDQQLDPNRPKVTVPREPNLETAYRAKKHSSRMKLESAENQKANACTFKARPLNRKILRAPSMPRCKKSTPQMPEFQEFHLRTTERAMQHVSVNVGDQKQFVLSQRVNSVLKEKFEVQDKIKKEPNYSAAKVYPEEVPIELFNKLSLTSEVHANAKTQTKIRIYSEGSKENTPGSLNLMKEMMSVGKVERHPGNRCQYGDDWRFPQINVNRSLALQ